MMGKADSITVQNFPERHYIPAMISIKVGKRSVFSTTSQRFKVPGEARSAALALASAYGIAVDEKTEWIMLLDPSADSSE